MTEKQLLHQIGHMCLEDTRWLEGDRIRVRKCGETQFVVIEHDPATGRALIEYRQVLNAPRQVVAEVAQIMAAWERVEVAA